ncbi:hypothetical protein K505DRAFT_321662 [Melanomma pulvis-pyrius CBS 109.77]|uniref:F-box domain-containing protein n=1 Tax=Melanomma pulvis-pyrius CBS 109.77 TaxID=1314802 RepID=A0A6A6XQZ0_9PLEO|nr:hypothetical protein K505DRAFT_321662 [Melanomma pulvis-pyrius CBS 109.77]
MSCTRYDPVANVSKDEDFPVIVEQILRDLTLFPKLEGLTVEFPWDSKEVDQGFLDLHEVVVAEKQKAWRELMARSYAAIGHAADPQRPSLKSLEIRNIVATEVTTWASARFRKFLAQLQSFSLSIRGIKYFEDCLQYWSPWNFPVDNYEWFIPRLDHYFFNHLLNVESFSFTAAESRFPGLEGPCYISFPLNANQMPKLKRLELGYIFIAPELSDFLNSHAKTMEMIRLENCFSAVGERGGATNAISWAQLFTTFIEAGPTKLKEFEVLNVEFSFEDDHWNGDNIITARELRGTPAFSHAFVNTRYGLMVEDKEEDLKSFFRGENQMAFDRLLTLIESNV